MPAKTSFNSLPREIRDMIYDNTLSDLRLTIRINIDQAYQYPYWGNQAVTHASPKLDIPDNDNLAEQISHQNHTLGLLLACRTTYNDLKDKIYNYMRLDIMASHIIPALKSPEFERPAATAKFLRRLASHQVIGPMIKSAHTLALPAYFIDGLSLEFQDRRPRMFNNLKSLTIYEDAAEQRQEDRSWYLRRPDEDEHHRYWRRAHLHQKEISDRADGFLRELPSRYGITVKTVVPAMEQYAKRRQFDRSLINMDRVQGLVLEMEDSKEGKHGKWWRDLGEEDVRVKDMLEEEWKIDQGKLDAVASGFDAENRAQLKQKRLREQNAMRAMRMQKEQEQEA